MSVKIKGLDKAIRDIEKYSLKTQEGIRKQTDQAASRVLTKATNRAQSTRIKNSMGKEIHDKGFTARVFASNPLAVLFEFGTGPRYQNNGRYTGMMRARPFLFPSWEEERNNYIKALGKELKKI